jgi:hypothetical protein
VIQARLLSFFFFEPFALFALFGLSALTLLPEQGYAETVCQHYRKEAPNLYKILCTNGGAVTTKPAGASSTFSSAFSLNSASLPTEPSSYGLETIVSYFRNDSFHMGPTFSIVKGFQRFGTGVSTSSNNTFFGNDIVQRAVGSSNIDSFEPHEPAKGAFANLNLGTSFTVIEPDHGPTLRLGLSVRYNKTTDTLGGGPGLMLNWKRFTFGGGYTRERVSNLLPRVTFINLMASARVSLLEFEFTRLSNVGGFDLKPIYILSTAATFRKLTLTVAVRRLNYYLEGDVTQTHFAVQYLFSKNFSAGYLVNYIPGTASIGTQFYL